MAFTEQQIQEIKEIVNDVTSKKGLNWKIVQTLPTIKEPNTLYFLQVSIAPRKFVLYSTDKDGEIASLELE